MRVIGASFSMVGMMVDNELESRLMVLMFTDLVGSVDLKTRLGASVYANLISRHDTLFRQIISSTPAAEIRNDTGDGFLARFATATDAVCAALRFQYAMRAEPWEPEALHVRIGVHIGQVTELDTEESAGVPKLVGLAADITARIVSLALPDQILLTRTAFDDARQYVREHPATDGNNEALQLRWVAHGPYLFKGNDEPLDVFEVGAVSTAPLKEPPDTEKARRAILPGEEEMYGWRPSSGQSIPLRDNWVLEKKIGEGGFGEVWLARHKKTGTNRVFKFCFDAGRLRSFKRELTLFRLVREALGDRPDIARIHDIQLDKPPFYLESEFTKAGNLADWAEAQGGIDHVPLSTRLDLMAQLCDAVAAAHSIGILHKDIKPSNVLMYESADGVPHPSLADFGIGALTDWSQMERYNLTATGFTETLVDASGSSRTGTRMYAPPESMAGKAFTIQGDVYALGVLLYQMVAGDLQRPLAQGWERAIEDDILREDIALCVEGEPKRRMPGANELAQRLRRLKERGAERSSAEAAAKRDAHRRRLVRFGVAAVVVLALLLSLTAIGLVRERGLRANAQFRERQARIEAVQSFRALESVLPLVRRAPDLIYLAPETVKREFPVAVLDKADEWLAELFPEWLHLFYASYLMDGDFEAAAKKRVAAPVEYALEQYHLDPFASGNAPLYDWIRANRDRFNILIETSRNFRFDMSARIHSSDAPLVSVGLPYLAELRKVVQLLCANAVLHHIDGEWQEAIETLRAARRLSRDTVASPLIVDALTELAMRRFIYEIYRWLVVDAAAGGHCTPDYTAFIIEDPPMARLDFVFQQNARMRRQIAGSKFEQYDESEPPKVSMSALDGYVAMSDDQRDRLADLNYAELITAITDNARIAQEHHDATFGELDELSAQIDELFPVPAEALDFFRTSHASTIRGWRRAQMNRDASILTAAICAYRCAHGRWPDSLDQALASFEVKPVAMSYYGHGFIYRLEQGHPLLYVVGADFTDDGGRSWYEQTVYTDRDDDVFIMPPARRQSIYPKIQTSDRPLELLDEAWRTGRYPGADPEEYIEALQKAEEAVALLPDSAYATMILGVTRYRTGHYQPALNALGRYEELGGEPRPGVQAFAAMAHDQLGQEREAREALRRLRNLMGEPRYSHLEALLRETEALIEGK